ncbi:hypothetical protein [Hymenobacter crusticola]|uniref:Tetratricopeptide repeat protein n=1 Tax=Hymenobacter crusticola TaxID=1770526 RepID=A0A243W7A3_9BACT|nr:hypothetical protein [Hymenobacter crusticola]OUJ70855.1 hypothetical protein BXP70_23265 [Hymenobacter crusticola]
MKNTRILSRLVLCVFLLGVGGACRDKKTPPAARQEVETIGLIAGQRLMCGAPEQQFGTVRFPVACRAELQADFALGLKLLHSFEYEEAEKVFAAILRQQPDCAMAYWGVAMSSFHPLWTPPSEPELRKGAKALAAARALAQPSPREADYLATVAAFYQDWPTVDHHTRCRRFEDASAALAGKYPHDTEAATFYALALTAAADPADTTFAKQKKAGAILKALYPKNPDHPGIVHYIIHAYDAPPLAHLALLAARRYAAVAPSSAHALHMPSHIFTRLGLWDECITSNAASAASARCYAQQTGIVGHWDEELHSVDYLMYAYLQKGDNQRAERQRRYLATITEVHPVTFKVAYAFAAIPARYVLENKRWAEAAALQSHPANFAWETFPWQRAIIHFTRLLGAVHTDNPSAAQAELRELERLHARLLQQKDQYKANQVYIQLTAGQAWLQWQAGHPTEAVQRMTLAADLEDQTEKHPVTPSEVVPARELLGDMLLQLKRPAAALAAYEADLQKHPNRLNGLYGAGVAAAQAGRATIARQYYSQLLASARPSGAPRPELAVAQRFLARQ